MTLTEELRERAWDDKTGLLHAAVDRMEQLEEALFRVQQWAEAYPLDAFPEPDWKRAAEVLKEHGMTLDSISAGITRHVVAGLGGIAREALA